MDTRVRREEALQERGSRTFAAHEKYPRRRRLFLLWCWFVELGIRTRRSFLLDVQTKESSLSPILRPLTMQSAQVVSGGHFFYEGRNGGSRLHQKRKAHRSSPLLLFEEVSFARADLDESSCESLKPFVKT